MPTIPFPVVHSILDAEALGRELAGRYALPGEIFCRLELRGVNDLYRVRSGSGTLACRVWRTGRQPDWPVAYELEFLRFLDREGVPVAPPVEARDGTLFFTVEAPEGTREIALFRWVDGRRSSLADESVFGLIGEEAARLHLAATAFRSPLAQRRRDDAAYIRRKLPGLLRSVAGRAADVELYGHGAGLVLAFLDSLDLGPRQAIHGDLHYDNVLVDAAGRPTLMDLDAAGEDWPVKDLAAFLWRCDYGLAPHDFNRRFLEGYERIRALSPAERAALPALVAARELFIFSGVAEIVNRPPAAAMAGELDRNRDSFRRHLAAAGLA
ncbi:MAG: hypothetical protein FJX53_09525 [Alphaproteobacteria bacterium]|nr:hypothetical protein [Alphaproteobacteria bacterium]